MRPRVAFAICAFITLGILVSLRHHIRDLGEVVKTYSGFYPYLDSHPGTLFRYQRLGSSESDSQYDTELAPRILHQIYLTEGRLSSISKYLPARKSCEELHPNWTHHLWTDKTGTEFIADHYPGMLPHYQGYKQSIQRANILRYALLHHYGGVYLDLDITCLQPLDNLRSLPFVTPGAYPAGVNNAFILSTPRHGFLQHLLDGVPSRDLSWGMPYIENMLSTGCMFFSNRWMSYVRGLKANPIEGSEVYILANATGDIEPHMLRGAVITPLFEHGGASSWHGWDAAAIVLIGKHYNYVLFLLATALLLSGMLVCKVLWKAARRPGKSPTAVLTSIVRRSMDKTEDSEASVGIKEG
jgi:inositol phosphorylceramide mannosyltransferase catalytic subunit